ncbi:MAG: glycosyltransferase family 39 protein [Anaerolineaceae bacterium]|nr:glycosyltransferase family 39 protein [Anaerolineaceae bacterium]MCB9100345.1 glycosyltransferase family 39 protein [Anaerolineales bacterium]
MSKAGRAVKQKNSVIAAGVMVYLGLFFLALLPRVYDLPRFVTADEAKWVYRSAQFWAALLRGDPAGTSVNLTPAVTTTWLGSLGLAFYYQFNHAVIGLPLLDWLTSLPEFRTDLPVLVATRWSMAIATSLGVVIIYGLARPLFGATVAFMGAVFVAFDPHTVSLSRILGHDAPTAMLMMISILLLLRGSRVAGGQSSRVARLQGGRGAGGQSDRDERLQDGEVVGGWGGTFYVVLSGVAAGLAFLSKAPALFLIPLAGLFLVSRLWFDRSAIGVWIGQFLLWGLAAYLTFVIVWPAAWVDPLGRPWAVVENGFISATDQDEADDENYWLVPDLGPFYYIIHGVFKLSPLVMVGLVVMLGGGLIHRPDRTDRQAGMVFDSPIFWLTTFALLFTLFMTLGDKRSPRYILPIFPPLAFIAAAGWDRLYLIFIRRDQTKRRPAADLRRLPFVITLMVSAGVILLPYAPYYFSYFNPLAGGPFLAPHVVKYGWGEGLDQVGRFLQRVVPGSRVGTPYASTVAPYFAGRLLDISGDHLDYIVLYSKQLQSGEPSPKAIEYYNTGGSVFSVTLNGLPYANVFAGPALQMLPSGTGPIGYRPLSPYGSIGQPLDVDVLWSAEEISPSASPIVTLRPTADNGALAAPSPAGSSTSILAQGPGSLTPIGEALVVSRHRLNLPEELERGRYRLFVDGQPLGDLDLRWFEAPPNLSRAGEINFEGQIALVGYQINPSTDFVGITVAWQAKQSPLADYTIFAQILEAETNERVAGVDTQPLNGTLPTSTWLNGEVVVDEYLIAVPFDFQPGYYKVIIGLYQPDKGRRLLLADGQDYWTVPWTFIRKDRPD